MSIFSHPGRFDPRFDPEGALDRLQELGRFFEEPFGFNLGATARGGRPSVNVYREGEDLVVDFEVPGVAPENVSIEVTGRTLTVSGKRELAVPAEGTFHRRERWGGEFRRSLALPALWDLAKAEAVQENGVLRIRVSKREELKPRQIEVKVK